MSELIYMGKERDESDDLKEAILGRDKGIIYPGGLTLHLDEETLQKLLVTGVPQLGDRVHLKAFATVAGLGENELMSAERDRSVKLQITHMRISHALDSRDADTQTLYGQPEPAKVMR